MSKDFKTGLFIPPYLAEFPLYKHFATVTDHILNDDSSDFSTVEPLSEDMKLFFGEDLTTDQQESVLYYYKTSVEPYLGTKEALNKLFDTLGLKARVKVWFENRVPLSPYRFNIEFDEVAEDFDFSAFLRLIDIVKNERSHISAIINAGSPDTSVWDYSGWGRDCWDNPTGVMINGTLFNISKTMSKFQDDLLEDSEVFSGLIYTFNLYYGYDLTPKINARLKLNVSSEIFKRFFTEISGYFFSFRGYSNFKGVRDRVVWNGIVINYPENIWFHITGYSKVTKENGFIKKVFSSAGLDLFISATVSEPMQIAEIIIPPTEEIIPPEEGEEVIVREKEQLLELDFAEMKMTLPASEDFSNFEIRMELRLNHKTDSILTIFSVGEANIRLSTETIAISTLTGFEEFEYSEVLEWETIILTNSSISIGEDTFNYNVELFPTDFTLGNSGSSIVLKDLQIMR